MIFSFLLCTYYYYYYYYYYFCIMQYFLLYDVSFFHFCSQKTLLEARNKFKIKIRYSTDVIL